MPTQQSALLQDVESNGIKLGDMEGGPSDAFIDVGIKICSITVCGCAVAALSACRTDVLEFARHTLCEETIRTATVVSLTQRLLASPYTDTVFGCMVARYEPTVIDNAHKKNFHATIRMFTAQKETYVFTHALGQCELSMHTHACMLGHRQEPSLSLSFCLMGLLHCVHLAILGCQTGASHSQHSSGVRLCATCFSLLIICHVNHRAVVWKRSVRVIMTSKF